MIVSKLLQMCAVSGMLLSIAGCGPEQVEHPDTVAVTGKITLDGKPLAGASIIFNPVVTSDETFPARATSKEDGTYELNTFFSASTDEPGAVPGQYNVTVTKAAAAAAPQSHGDVDMSAPQGKPDAHSSGPENALPAKYQSPTTSGIKKEVKADGANDIPIELKSE